MSETTETPETTQSAPAAADPLLDRNASLAELGAHWASLASKPGTVEPGRVVASGPEGVIVEVAAGRGTLPAAELRGLHPAVGDTVRVFIEQVLSTGPTLSLDKARALDLFDRLEAAADRDEAVEGTVLARMSGGFSVDVGLKAFLPGRADGPLGDGRPSRFWVRGWDDRKDMFLLAREPRASREARETKKTRARDAEAAATVEGGAEGAAAAPGVPVTLPVEGSVERGKVVRLADFGAFVELPGGATGLLHVKDLSWGRVGHPSEVVAVGDEVEVKVLKVSASQGAAEGGKGERIQLSRRALLPAPWATVAERLQVGQTISGPVVGFAEYGAFVEVEPGVEGLVHVSELGWGPAPKHPSEVLKAGDRVSAEILLLDPEKKHLKLSIRKCQPSPWLHVRERLPVGTRVQGKVKNVASFGVFVVLEEVPGIEGLVHTSDLSWTPVGRVSEQYKAGQPIDALVLGIDEERGRLSLGVKQLGPEPERPSLSGLAVGQRLTGRVQRIKDFGAFIEIAPGVEGLAHAGEMGLAEGQRPKDRLKVGASVEVVVASLDVEARRIGLVVQFDAPASEPAAESAAEPGPESPPEA